MLESSVVYKMISATMGHMDSNLIQQNRTDGDDGNIGQELDKNMPLTTNNITTTSNENIPDMTNQTQVPENSNTKETFISKLTNNGELGIFQIINLLVLGTPNDLEQYSEHVFKVLSIIYEDEGISQEDCTRLTEKLYELFDNLNYFITLNNPMYSKLYLIIEKNFDILIKISVNEKTLTLSSAAIRFLTNVIMNLNYWEIYNLLSWKPAIYHFLSVIQFNLNDCYHKFINDYSKYNFKQKALAYNKKNIGKKTKRLSDYAKHLSAKRTAYNEANNKVTAANLKAIGKNDEDLGNFDDLNNDLDDTKVSGSNTPNSSIADNNLQYSQHSRSSSISNQSLLYNHENPQSEELTLVHNGTTSQIYNARGEPLDIPASDAFINSDLRSLAAKDKRRITIEPKLARKIIKRANTRISAKSSNYDPDVVHECQLSSADEPGAICLRRFSRKYELIRHQETVHSKKKKLFKCYVCVKQSPGIGPRIFTRHDTLAKHIRVNHKISGKEAKQEVAYSKKNAEIVEEGDITVHVGRRKTKVDFELRAHMEKRRMAKIDGVDYYDDDDGSLMLEDDTNNSLMLDDEDDMIDDQEGDQYRDDRQDMDDEDEGEDEEAGMATHDTSMAPGRGNLVGENKPNLPQLPSHQNTSGAFQLPPPTNQFQQPSTSQLHPLPPFLTSHKSPSQQGSPGQSHQLPQPQGLSSQGGDPQFRQFIPQYTFPQNASYQSSPPAAQQQVPQPPHESNPP